ncbi:hypothetical protein HX099_10745 [Thiopseudomonas alkaliphila]|uniref:Uncharacterized protein n=1 Tax=Thiopseudomonas alkaliphila TaxID=1697053 RepID=A0AAW7DSZ2_9GAMM|nr:hypothetical protein [Thiopseudomonas alkaliphila]MDM1697130.1 hypothetical protein [Thiopseudomonas alkaliphila]
MTPFQAQIDINEPNRQLLTKLQKDYERQHGKIKTQPLIQRNKAAYFNGKPKSKGAITCLS